MSILEKINAADYAFSMATDFSGACPCAYFRFKDKNGIVYAHSRCWRVSDNDQDLYVWGEHPDISKIARALKKSLDRTEWYGQYTIIYEEFK